MENTFITFKLFSPNYYELVEKSFLIFLFKESNKIWWLYPVKSAVKLTHICTTGVQQQCTGVSNQLCNKKLFICVQKTCKSTVSVYICISVTVYQCTGGMQSTLLLYPVNCAIKLPLISAGDTQQNRVVVFNTFAIQLPHMCPPFMQHYCTAD